MTCRIFSVIGTDEIEVDCPRHGTFITRDVSRAEQWAKLHDYCRERRDAHRPTLVFRRSIL